MSHAESFRFAPSVRRLNGLARWALVAMPLVSSSVAVGDGGLLATTGVIGLASSLAPMIEADVQAVDARVQAEALAARSTAVDMHQVIPSRPRAGGAISRPTAPLAPETSAPAVTFRPARPRTAAEIRASLTPSVPAAPAHGAPARPTVTAPTRVEGPRPEVTRPVTGDRPAMPFSRLVSQVRY